MSKSRAPDVRAKRGGTQTASSDRAKSVPEAGPHAKLARGTRDAMQPVATDDDTVIVDVEAEAVADLHDVLEAVADDGDGTVESVDASDGSAADIDAHMLELG